MSSAVIGAAIGSLGAFYAARTMRGIIVGMTGLDPLALVAIVGSLLFTALIACLVPATRAAAVDPMIALRRE
jgi:putative ABC transport system permease protein